MPLTFRPAAPEDAAFAGPLIQEAIGDIGWELTGTDNDAAAAQAITELFAQPGHRMSYDVCLLAADQASGQPLGLALSYPGEQSQALDEPLRRRLREGGHPADFPSEGSPGELYLDTLAVAGAARGRGVGGGLLAALTDRAHALGLTQIGLLVAEDNPAARLYARSGYRPVGERTLAGHRYFHLQRQVSAAPE
ncbi:GNAT family N-acetyltransferase [Deinococcus piscis]|uniref:GNAT family N-acetyltransferase n=1 Tax=Deinococcus piscis TaxID=394230 RepID=A0ABQ3K139_9DEIO|nr:GNAT family N-acetyltransferase [Deinococcus piscis]GHF92702.1 GNAT family N-acetyltransferase [Deinococcus piscis]